LDCINKCAEVVVVERVTAISLPVTFWAKMDARKPCDCPCQGRFFVPVILRANVVRSGLEQDQLAIIRCLDFTFSRLLMRDRENLQKSPPTKQ